MGRPKKIKTPVDECIDNFSAFFAERFEGKRILKTPFHFFNFATGGEEVKRNELLEKFETYCRRTKARAVWRNAAEWYVTGSIGRKSK